MPDPTGDMTLEEQIGQVLMVGFRGTTPSPEILDLIQNDHIGSVILFSRNVQDAQQVWQLTSALQMAARAAGHRYPLLIAIDQENGMVQRLGQGATSFPGNMAQGAIGSEQITHAIALATGQEMRAPGINMNLAPVVDVNNNPANPVIGVRSFGEDAQLVARLGAAAMKGFHEAGVVSCLKHFPGHGDTDVDSHLALPTIPYTMDRLETTELLPFKSGIEAGADCVMIAHIAFPSLTHDEHLPATLSPAIVRGLLREQMRFDGVIISDCLEMNAISATVGVPRGAVLALQAGIDLVLISHQYARQQAAIEAIQRAVQAGELLAEAVAQAARRVIALKERALSWEDLPPSSATTVIGSESHQALRDTAYALSTTLVKNEKGLLPLHLASGDRLLLLIPRRTALTVVEDGHYPHDFLLEHVQQRHTNTTALFISPQPTRADFAEIERVVKEANTVIMVTVNAYQDRQQGELMQRLLQSERPIIGLAVYSPYDFLTFPELSTYMVTYEYTKSALAAATRVLFGETQPRGRLPVSLQL